MSKYIKRSMRLAIPMLGWLSLASAQAASFDCGKAQAKVEHLICDNPEISKLDDELAAAYKMALQDQAQPEAVKQAQKQWLKAERNACMNAGCLKAAYQARIQELTGAVSIRPDSNKQNAEGNISINGQKYHFRMTKGAGVPVCDAYLERLNTTEYEKPPYCDRPESEAIQGFAKLNRVPLSPGDVRDLYPIVGDFIASANQKNLDWTDMKLQQQLTETGRDKLSDASAKSLQMDLDAGWAKMWRYEPPIDIDNDGVPDNVEVWQGLPLRGGVGGTQCGGYMYKFPNDPPLRQPQVAFVVTGNNDRLDVIKTEKIFAHPKGGYRFFSTAEQKWKISDDFRPIGDSMGIFKYQDMYYFDTFFDGWGDFENKRRIVYTRRKNKQIVNTLAVFLHKDGKTRQVCEYLMTDNETQNKGETK